jgi:hypothetical protein
VRSNKEMCIHVKPEIWKVWDFQGCDYEDYCLQATLKTDAANYSETQLILPENMVPRQRRHQSSTGKRSQTPRRSECLSGRQTLATIMQI